jgi:hypothetical protein
MGRETTYADGGLVGKDNSSNRKKSGFLYRRSKVLMEQLNLQVVVPTKHRDAGSADIGSSAETA